MSHQSDGTQGEDQEYDWTEGDLIRVEFRVFVVAVGEGVVVVCGCWLQATVKRKQQLNSVINFVSWRNRFQGQNPLMIII